PIIGKEPTIEESVQILQGIKDRYKEFHGVSYSDEVVHAFVNLSDRYIQDRFLPDKAIDLMVEVGSRLNLANASKDTNTLQKQIDKANESQKEMSAEVTVHDIEEIVEEKTGIPVTKLQADEQEKLRNIKDQLSAKVIGQENAVDSISKAVRRSRAGLKSK